MRRVGFGTAAFAVLFLACVGDSGGSLTTPDAGDASGAQVQDGATEDVSVQDGGQDVAPPTCDAGTTFCGSSCVDLQSSADHCNGCGHSCGGGSCTAGVCAPITRVSGLAASDFAVDGSVLVFTANNLVQSCSVDGPCAGAGLKKLADFTGANPSGTGAIAAASGSFAFAGNTDGNARLYACPLATGCATLTSKGSSMAGYPTIVASTQNATTYGVYVHNPMVGIQGFTCVSGTCGTLSVISPKTEAAGLLGASAAEVYYASAVGGAVYRCPVNAYPCVGVPFMAPSALSFAVSGADRYLRFVTAQGRSAIGHCPATGCPGGNNQPTVVWQTLGSILTIAADGDEVFWAEEGGGGSQIRACKRGVNCNLPRDLAKFSISPTKMIVTPKSVLWLDTNGDIVSLAR